jgi:hypothetical protein
MKYSKGDLIEYKGMLLLVRSVSEHNFYNLIPLYFPEQHLKNAYGTMTGMTISYMDRFSNKAIK